jgi:hypothetical protein
MRIARRGSTGSSTGYAYQRIQQMADLCAAQTPCDHIDLRLTAQTRFMDGIFLRERQHEKTYCYHRTTFLSR